MYVTDSEKNTLGGDYNFGILVLLRISGLLADTVLPSGPPRINCIEMPYVECCIDATGRNCIWCSAQPEIRGIRLREVRQSEMRCNVYTEACSMDKRTTEGKVTYTYSIKLACE